MAILVTYASRHGSTAEVAKRVADTLWASDVDVSIAEVGEVDSLAGFEAVVLGAPIYMGRWQREALGFLKRHRAELAGLPVAIFALGPMSDDPEERASSRDSLDAALAKTPWLEPRDVAVFGGRIDPELLRFPFSHMAAKDVRDWDAIEAWAGGLAEALEVTAVRT